jgi:hypothetical protein
MAAPEHRPLHIEVAHGGEEEVAVLPLQVQPGTTVAGAVAQSGILQRFPYLDLNRNAVGIFGRKVSPDTVVADGDRVEIYRPVKADAKEVRRRRASRQRRTGS